MGPGWRTRPGAVFVASAVAFSLVLRLLPPGAKEPLANLLLETAYAPFFAVRNWADHLVNLRRQNAELRLALAEASARAQQHAQAARELGRLRDLLRSPPPAAPGARVAQIVGWQKSGGREEVMVDRGRRGGISLYAPALTEDGVAGKVIGVMENFARVQLLTDPACRIAVRDARSGVLGVARIGQSGRLHMEYVAAEADVQTGDSIFTAGIGGIFPEGLLVGIVRSVERVPSSLLLIVILHPAARFDRLDYLFFVERDEPLPPGAPYEYRPESP